jgi:hypothetical protein
MSFRGPCAEGPDSSLVHHRTDSPWRTWGNAPGSIAALWPAPKARLTFATSAIENELVDETRFQRLFDELSSSWGNAPGLN